MDSKDLCLIRKRLAFLLAKAACEVFPDAQIINIQGTPFVFFADICFSQDFVEAFTPLIEDHLRNLVKNRQPIVKAEMVPRSAKGLLEKAGQKLQILQLPSHPHALVEVSSLGDFSLLSSLNEEESLETSRFFWEIIYAGEGGETSESQGSLPITRIMGIVCPDLSTLKQTKKAWIKKPYIPTSHLVQQVDVLMEHAQGWVWLPRGEKLRYELHKFLRNFLEKENFCFVSTGGIAPLEQGLKEVLTHLSFHNPHTTGELRLAEVVYAFDENEDFQKEGILTPITGWTDRFVRICPKERLLEACISSLQFILQIPRMLSFDTQVVLCTSLSGDTKDLRIALETASVDYSCERTDRQYACIEVRIGDRLGRWWPGPSLWIGKERFLPQQRAVFATCLGKWERLIGLLVEKLNDGSESQIEQFIQKLKQE